MSTTQQTLLTISHPTFREGYQKGREYYFQENERLDDRQLVELLQDVFEESQKDKVEEREAGVFYAIGQLIGQMSGCVLPYQPSEEKTQDLQEAFLSRVSLEYGETRPALISTIQQFWTIQAQLARAFDADTFEEMLNVVQKRRSD